MTCRDGSARTRRTAVPRNAIVHRTVGKARAGWYVLPVDGFFVLFRTWRRESASTEPQSTTLISVAQRLPHYPHGTVYGLQDQILIV